MRKWVYCLMAALFVFTLSLPSYASEKQNGVNTKNVVHQLTIDGFGDMTETSPGVLEACLTLKGNWSFRLRTCDGDFLDLSSYKFVSSVTKAQIYGNSSIQSVGSCLDAVRYHVKVDSNVGAVYLLPADREVVSGKGGYLWIFMTHANYGKMFYALSRDCLNWETLNKNSEGAQIINPFIRLHPAITRGHDGAWYQFGVEKFRRDRILTIWRTEDFLEWSTEEIPASLFKVEGWDVDGDHGAPKLYYDESEATYIITWHAGKPYSNHNARRTMYVTSKDLKTFTKPELLYNFKDDWADCGIIDTYIQKIGRKYYAVAKDETWVDELHPEGKTIFMAESRNLTGPYVRPERVLPNKPYQREAPILVEDPDGNWLLFAELFFQKPYGYQVFKSKKPKGPYSQIEEWTAPDVADGTPRSGPRHGCIVKIDESTYATLQNFYY